MGAVCHDQREKLQSIDANLLSASSVMAYPACRCNANVRQTIGRYSLLDARSDLHRWLHLHRPLTILRSIEICSLISSSREYQNLDPPYEGVVAWT